MDVYSRVVWLNTKDFHDTKQVTKIDKTKERILVEYRVRENSKWVTVGGVYREGFHSEKRSPT